MYTRRIAATIGATCTLALVVSACGGSDSSTAGGGPKTIKIGIISTLSGPASATFAASVAGVEARFGAYKDAGGKCASTTFDVVKADDASSAAGALTATQKLVQQDKVFSLIEVTPYFYGAAPFLTTTAKTTPVFGGAWDGSPQWSDVKNNLMPSGDVPDYTKVYATIGLYLKSVGGTKVAALAYESPSAQKGLAASVKSAEAAGLTKGYVNNSIAFGSTDVGAIVLGIIASKSDVLNLSINPDTAFAVAAGLKQANYPIKAIVAPTGYGADLLDSAPAVAAGEGVTFSVSQTPNELKTPATEVLSAALKKYAGSKSGVPSFSQIQAWMGADLFLHGLDLAGCDADQAKLISTVKADKTWDADGLYPSKKDFSTVSLDKSCSFFVKLTKGAFVPEPNAAPLCGGIVG